MGFVVFIVASQIIVFAGFYSFFFLYSFYKDGGRIRNNLHILKKKRENFLQKNLDNSLGYILCES